MCPCGWERVCLIGTCCCTCRCCSITSACVAHAACYAPLSGPRPCVCAVLLALYTSCTGIVFVCHVCFLQLQGSQDAETTPAEPTVIQWDQPQKRLARAAQLVAYRADLQRRTDKGVELLSTASQALSSEFSRTEVDTVKADIRKAMSGKHRRPGLWIK